MFHFRQAFDAMRPKPVNPTPARRGAVIDTDARRALYVGSYAEAKSSAEQFDGAVAAIGADASHILVIEIGQPVPAKHARAVAEALALADIG
jgi:hypothetical protein